MDSPAPSRDEVLDADGLQVQQVRDGLVDLARLGIGLVPHAHGDEVRAHVLCAAAAEHLRGALMNVWEL